LRKNIQDLDEGSESLRDHKLHWRGCPMAAFRLDDLDAVEIGSVSEPAMAMIKLAPGLA
jgi:hypothetical protein